MKWPLRNKKLLNLLGVLIVLQIFLAVRTFLRHFYSTETAIESDPRDLIREKSQIDELHRRIHGNAKVEATVQSVNLSFSHSYINYTPRTITLKRDSNIYVKRENNLTCFLEGTKGIARNNPRWVGSPRVDQFEKYRCICKPEWNGTHCSIPVSLASSNFPRAYRGKVLLRREPRRVVYGFPFNMEFEMLEARLYELHDVVDVFLILESSYTGSGERKSLKLLDKLRQGYLSTYKKKICYVLLDYFPREAKSNGWIADDLFRNHIVTQGLLKQIKGIRHDDMFVLTDADELPIRDAILFLKHHEGFPEPIGFHLHSAIYRYFWTTGSTVPVMAACSMRMLKDVFNNKAIELRGAIRYITKETFNVRAYRLKGGYLSLWYLGSPESYVGWHCSWCLDIERIQTKLVSAFNIDNPRWGDFPEKRDPSYIQKLIRIGCYFDDITFYKRRKENDTFLYAPKYFLENRERFNWLLYGSISL